MSTRGKTVVRAACALFLALVLVAPTACEGDGGGNGGGSDTAGADTGGNITPDVAAKEDIGEVQRTLFKATVKDFQTRIAHKDAVCWLLFNPYPEDYAQFTDDATVVFKRVPQGLLDVITGGGYTNPITSGDDGALEMMLPAGTRWGWECDKGEGDVYRKTYQFNISADSANFADEEIWIIPNGLYNLAPQLANIELDSSLGVVAGRLVWYNDADEEEYVGCGTVTTEPVTDDIRYFGDNDLPTATAAEGGRDTSHPVNGLFIGANMPLGPVTMTAKVGETVIGRETIFSEGEAVVISNIHTGVVRPQDDPLDPFTANPTPANCQ